MTHSEMNTEGAPPSVFLRVYLPWQVGLVTWNMQNAHPGPSSKCPLLDSCSIYAECPNRYRTNIALAGTPIFGAILLEGFCRLIIHINKAHQTHRMLPSPMDLRHARKM